ncbi:LysE/ArgO family amino acid transporter [Vibrio sp. JC009]|uniref:LysE/ArgO family amino acid transporter n=1 Tax=Vibrio sp. JC009 TaxID=2912314 RepID=UPI0023B0FD9A|nr:LysE/ArgO family amino acid transporter [Vibrio sp. JC009]WED22223.1 LysE/ArgO family amino acid transporter [Vibrio sp. JC009]
MNFWILLQGFTLGAGMIIPIGAQNAYVLNQGIKRNHHLTTATLCSLLDILFISVGVFGGGALLSQNELLLNSVTVGGVGFLSYYGYLSLKSALNPQPEEIELEGSKRRKRAVIAGALAVTVLNPHVYLDTIVVLGSIGGQFEGVNRISFAVGTMLASLTWFYGLAIGAAKAAPLLSQPKVQRGIDAVVALIMFAIATSLAKELYLQYA